MVPSDGKLRVDQTGMLGKVVKTTVTQGGHLVVNVTSGWQTGSEQECSKCSKCSMACFSVRKTM